MAKARLDVSRQFLNKWQMHNALAGQDLGPVSLPFTDLLKPHTLRRVLRRHRKAYVKPVDSWGGRNVFIVEQVGNTFRCYARSSEVRRYSALRHLVDDMYRNTAAQWIVQQPAPLLRYQGKPFDIRVHLQRDANNDWVNAGMLVRVAGTDAVVSNVGASDGRVVPLDTVVTELFPRDPGASHRTTQAACSVGERICRVLDTYRQFQDVGMDLGIDHSGRLWLIEVNTDDTCGAPSVELFRQLPDERVYNEMVERINKRQVSVVEWLLGGIFE